MVKLDGYRDTKWGMTQKQVLTMFKGKGKITDRDPDRLEVTLKPDTEVSFYFWKDQLEGVRVKPNVEESGQHDNPPLLKAMTEKLGPGASLTASDFIGLPLNIRRWQDDETMIDVRWHPDGYHVGPATHAIYQSRQLSAAKEAETAAQEAAKAAAEQRKAASAL